MGSSPDAMGFLTALSTTLKIGLSCILLMLVMSFVLSLAKKSPVRSISIGSTFLIEFLRANSAIVLLFWVFYSVPLLPGHWQPGVFFSAVVVLGGTAAAYASEIFRAATKAVPAGQYDACTALGIGFWRREFRIIYPQALPLALPSLSSMSIEVFKWTAAASLVTAQDVVTWTQASRNSTGNTLLLYGLLLAVFYIIGRLIAGVYAIIELLIRPKEERRRRRRVTRVVDVGLPVFLESDGS